MPVGGLQRHRRKVHRVRHVAVAQEGHQLIRRHRGAVLLRFRRAGAEMRRGVEVGDLGERRARKVGEVGAELAALEGALHGLFVHDLLAGEVEQHRAAAEPRQRLGIDQRDVLGHGGNVQRDAVRTREERGQVLHALDVARQPPRRLHRQRGIEAEHVHAEIQRRLGDPRADGAEADDAQRAPRHLAPLEAALFPLDDAMQLGIVRRLGERTDVLEPPQHVAGGEQQRG